MKQPKHKPQLHITRRGAMTVVLSPDRREVLLLRREFFILWDLPGGEIERGESPNEAAVRETREETGYSVKLQARVGEYLHQSVYGRGDQRTYAFRGHVTGGKPKYYGFESTGLKWFPVTNLPRGLEPLHRQIIADALKFSDELFKRRIDFPLWKLYPARVVFFISSRINFFLRKFYRFLRRFF